MSATPGRSWAARPPGKQAVIIGGGLIGMETADFLAQTGTKVTIVEILKRSPVLKITSHGYMLHTRLREAKVKFLFDTAVKRIEGLVVLLAEGGEETLSPVDQVVIAVGLKPRDDLKAFLQKRGPPFCRGRRGESAADHRGHRRRREGGLEPYLKAKRCRNCPVCGRVGNWGKEKEFYPFKICTLIFEFAPLSRIFPYEEDGHPKKTAAREKTFLGKAPDRGDLRQGILPYLKQEILSLGFPVLSESVAGIETEGAFEDTLNLNLHLRTGQRVLFLLEDFQAENAEELYNQIVPKSHGRSICLPTNISASPRRWTTPRSATPAMQM